MSHYILGFDEIDRTKLARVGGKAAHLGELSRIGGIEVPTGFCVTTDAFRRFLALATAVHPALDRLSRQPGDAAAISAEIRQILEHAVVPPDVAGAIGAAVAHLGEDVPCAVRSSATAEDLPTASSAGQHDSYLDIVGPTAILEHVRRCWASLFTERAVLYRLRNGVHEAAMAVVVQRMVAPVASGVLFTADPVTSNREIAAVEAVAGLGDALVSGRVRPEAWQVRGDAVVGRPIAGEAVLDDAQVIGLVRLGRRIEAHFGRPQDIEWCRADGRFQFVQSRAITALFPVPAAPDAEHRVYLSVGHNQMMTDAIKPLGISLWQLTTPRPMLPAGARLFVDVTQALAAPRARAALLETAGRTDPLVRDALQTVVDRGFVPTLPDTGPPPSPPASAPVDPAVVEASIARSQASIGALRRDIRGKAGPELIEFILDDLRELKRLLFDPQSHAAIMAGMEAAWWLDDHLQAWLQETGAADVLAQSAPHNVTSEMGLALLDVADAIRPHPEVTAFLARTDDDDHLLDDLAKIEGGREASESLRAWLDAYGMRGVGEIDVTRPRWSERPTALVPALLANVRSFRPGEHRRRHEQGLANARRKELELLARLAALPDGDRKAEETKRRIDRLRAFVGYREYPKYGMICRYFVYKQALLGEADRLVQAHVLAHREDIFFLTFDELHQVVRTHRVDGGLVARRKDEFRSAESLRPPRVLTSDGECVAGAYRRTNLPSGALVGLAVSAGDVQGRARVVLDPARATLEPGDILVTVFTDPSWTPLFVAIRGLVTEVGGRMTHGAVIAREYGLPAVVGVEDATRRIRDGQRIRVHGTQGYVEILD